MLCEVPKFRKVACSPKVFVLVSTGFVLFVLVDGTQALAKKGESKYTQNICFCTVFCTIRTGQKGFCTNGPLKSGEAKKSFFFVFRTGTLYWY